MTETSFYWDGLVTGDASLAPYSDTAYHLNWKKLFTREDNQGVIDSLQNELEVVGVAGGVTVATGNALVAGGKYENNTTSISVAIPTPVSDPRIDRIVLRRNWTEKETRVFRIAGTEAGAPSAPALVQITGTIWDMPLAQVLITTAGVITVTSEREFCRTPLAPVSVLSLIETLTPGGTGEIDFIDIPQTFRHLKIIGQAVASESGVGNVWYNGDTTAANYQRTVIAGFGAAAAASANLNLQTSISFRDSGGRTAGFATQFELTISNYTRSDIFKTGIQDEVAIHQNTDTTRYSVSKEGVVWKDTSPVTRLLIDSSAGILLSPSRVSLYGI